MTNVLAAAAARQEFMDAVAGLRPELHRYCARMTGSVFDGEDVVQDTLAKAWYALAELESIPPLRAWLFRIAHNACMDLLRRYENRNVDGSMDVYDVADMREASQMEQPPDATRVEHALHMFASLPPVQRSALALVDVLDLSLEESALTMGTTVGAVKSALVRARQNVAAISATRPVRPRHADTARLRRYSDLFNARDWDGLRALFGEETRLDVVSRHQSRGKAAAQYFTKYAEVIPAEALRTEVVLVEELPLLAVYRPWFSNVPAYFVRIEWRDEQVALVRDFRYASYIVTEAVVVDA
ncbi:MAG: sigma-70 family RNA polymerase sigma factor [Phycisphaerae bacterium]|nr:sigma-70 family RNA polymerase sigma factor [Gemmatimonadaceae bacterium]